MQSFDYLFNIGGNYSATINGITEATGKFSASVEGAQGKVTRFAQRLAVLDLASNYAEKLSNTISNFTEVGVSFDSQMHDLSAIAGVTDNALQEIEGYARESAKTFGTDAAVAVEGYKLLLSQLSPELGKYPAALQAMGDAIQTTSKLMGGDGTAAAEVLTTAMNQYGVSLADPMEASRRMAEMMNVMAAAGQEGSAELPAIKVALEQCGMAAKAANVSFEETNAAIQVLDKAGKKGSEGGVALRNTLAILGQGRFMPKDTREALQGAGIDVIKLADTSLTLKERLDMLKPVLNDAALFSKLFGMENSNAARALVQGSDQLARLTTAITGTASAEEQASIVMESKAEKQARLNQLLEDAKISVANLTGNFGIYASVVAQTLVPISQITPLIMGIGKGMRWIKNLQWAAMWAGVRTQLLSSVAGLALYNRTLATGIVVSGGFGANILQASLAVVRFATVGISQALKGLGALLLSLVTGGSASAAFATTASISFGTFRAAAVTACRAVGVALMNIPIVGWIATAVAGLVALVAYFWNTSVRFRAVLKGLGASFVAVFKGIWELAKNVFSGIGDLIKAAFSLDAGGIKAAIDRLKGGFSEFGSNVGKAFDDAYNAEMASARGGRAAAAPAARTPAGPEVPQVAMPVTGMDPTAGTLGTVGKSAGANNDKIKSITVNVGRLVERFEIHTTNLAGDMSRVKDMVSEALLSALNDVNLAI